MLKVKPLIAVCAIACLGLVGCSTGTSTDANKSESASKSTTQTSENKPEKPAVKEEKVPEAKLLVFLDKQFEQEGVKKKLLSIYDGDETYYKKTITCIAHSLKTNLTEDEQVGLLNGIAPKGKEKVIKDASFECGKKYGEEWAKNKMNK